jgi:hypothetical protein
MWRELVERLSREREREVSMTSPSSSAGRPTRTTSSKIAFDDLARDFEGPSLFGRVPFDAIEAARQLRDLLCERVDFRGKDRALTLDVGQLLFESAVLRVGIRSAEPVRIQA